MTMPKKGTRRITVDDKVYRYKIVKGDWKDKIKVVIENPEGKVFATMVERHDRDSANGYRAYTPKDVKELIEEKGI